MLFSRLLTLRLRSLRSISLSAASKSSTSKMEFLKLKDGKNLAYEKLPAKQRQSDSKSIIHIYGFQASSQTGKEGTKVSALRQFCLDHDYTFIR